MNVIKYVLDDSAALSSIEQGHQSTEAGHRKAVPEHLSLTLVIPRLALADFFLVYQYYQYCQTEHANKGGSPGSGG